jgi:hypothetical protein
MREKYQGKNSFVKKGGEETPIREEYFMSVKMSMIKNDNKLL